MQKTKRREWVKTFAIIFLVVLLILTFFSQTIMNRSLPEVAAQYVESGTINAKIRGSGAVSADETYDVTISQTRKIRSVLVKVGDTVNAGDVLFMLEPADSEELKTAQKTLSDLELAYQKSLIEAGNASSTENREVQKLRDAYNEALAVLRLYSNADPTQITMALKTAEANYKAQQQATKDANDALTAVQSDKDYTEAQAKVTELKGTISTAESAIETLKEQLATASGTDEQAYLDDLAKGYSTLREEYLKEYELDTQIKELQASAQTNTYTTTPASPTAEDGDAPITGTTVEEQIKALEKQLADLRTTIARDVILYGNQYNKVLEVAGQDHTVAAAYAANTALLRQALGQMNINPSAEAQKLLTKLREQETELSNASSDLAYYERKVSSFETEISRLEAILKDEQKKESALSDEVSNLTAASTAAETLKTAQTALEDKVFETSLGDASSLDLQNSKKAIEEQQKVVDELMAQADGQEVTANVSGKVTAINVTAGNSAGADTALATLTVVDRGYTVKIAVTADQAKQVTIGDTATITNYYNGDITATLENIANDPQNPGKGKLLVFRLSGEGVEAGSNITLSIGQRSATYDTLVPNSALRNDANGDFVLVVTAKNTPLGNRYTATRVGVTVLAKDDTKSAVTGLSSGDFVITTSTAPIEAGTQVRLVDNG